jgi:uncharacterized protein
MSAVTDSRIRPGGKVFRDPIHQLIRIEAADEVILDLIDTPEFQRLRRIRQLGVSWLTYPGAEHSRFVHSLGVFNFVQRIISVLRSRYAEHEVAHYLGEYGRIAKAAAILHDVGHGPFSHMIERAFSGRTNHETMTAQLICAKGGSIRRVLEQHGLEPDEVADLISHTSPHSLLTDMVSSQLDADRMDYLLRDSYATGVQYGKYDPEWLVNAVCVGRNPNRVSSDTDEGTRSWRLALDMRRGDKAAEQFILARAHMNEQVYFHRVTRGFEAMLLNLFQLAAKSAESGELPDTTPQVALKFFSKKALDTAEWLQFDEATMFTALHAWSNASLGVRPELKKLATAFLQRERLYRSVSIGKLKPLESALLGVELASSGLVKDVDWCFDNAESAVYKGLLTSAPEKSSDAEEVMVESILVASGKPSLRATPIESISSLMAHLNKQRSSVFRLYFDRSRTEKIRPILTKFGLSVDSEGAGS